MSNYRNFTLASLFVLAAAGPAMAQVVEGAKIITVDRQRILEQSAAGQDGTRQLKAQIDALQATVANFQDKFKKEEEALVKQKGLLQEDEFKKRVQDVQRREQAAEEEVNQKRTEIQRSQQYVLNQINAQILPVVQELMTARGANLVVDRGSIVVGSPALDVTAVVIDKLNVKLPRVSVTPPAPQQPAATPPKK